MHVSIQMRRREPHDLGTLNLRANLYLDLVKPGVLCDFGGVCVEIAVRFRKTGNQGTRSHRSPAIGLPLGRQCKMEADVSVRDATWRSRPLL